MPPTALICLLLSLAAPQPETELSSIQEHRLFCGPPQRLSSMLPSLLGDFISSPKKVRLIRQEKVYEVNLRKLRAHPELDVLVEPGDKVGIPQTYF